MTPVQPDSKPVVALFDFDGTLTCSDSFLPFLQTMVSPWQYWSRMLLLSPILGGYGLKLVSNWKAKEAVLAQFVKGRAEADLAKLGDRFAQQGIPKLLRPEAVKRLRWHQQQGHRTILVSASLEAYLIPWAREMGFEQVVSTRLECRDGALTGRLFGRNCYGDEKVERLREVLGDFSQYRIYAYGDSRGDREMLSIADHPYYRQFPNEAEDQTSGDDPPASAPPTGGGNWERGLILSVAVAAALYLGLVLWSGADQVWQAIDLLPVWLIPAMAAIVFFSYCLRFIRWQWYLSTMGYWVPLGDSFRIFLASFALTASPGKAGESVKSLLLKRRYDVPIPPTLAGLFCERFTDALSVVLLICLSFFSMFRASWAIALVGLFQLAVILLLQHPAFLKQRILKPLSRWPKLAGILQKVEALIDSASILLRPKILLGSTALAMVAWGLEGVAFYIIFQHLGATSVSLYQAVLTHTGSGLLGALSMLPGGIGSAEALTVSLSMMYGASQIAAVTGTFLIRLLTLWFAVAIGIVAMLSLQRSSRRPVGRQS
ncbi:MAG: HAD-IB family hydrolase [Synechococcales bacterium]|nr:HAD-IB family hydrolase [Synechococcales bacterium]